MGKLKSRFAWVGGSCRVLFVLGVTVPFSSAFAETKVATVPIAKEEAMQNDDLQLESVTVTAQRRQENIKDVPISVTSIKPETLDVINAGGADIRVLAARVPSLNIESSNGRTFPRFYIRGYGNTDFGTFASQPVSLMFDDVVQENPALKGFPLFDMESVEVLRGPQGTLFGRNTPAGVVKFDSAKPTLDKLYGYYSLSNGTYNTANAEAAINIPMNDEWALRFSALAQHRDDYVTNNGGGTPKLDGYDEQAGRVQLLYKPDNKFNALFNVHARETDGSARLFRGNVITKGTNNLVPNFDFSKVTFNGLNSQELSTAGASIRLTWNLDTVKLFSITGYESISNYYGRGDIDGGTTGGLNPTAFPSQTAGGVKGLGQFSQEFRVESKYDGPLNWQAGVYYFDEDVTGTSYNYGDSQLQTSYLQNRQKNKAYATFGSVTYDVNESLKLTGGMRYTKDDKDFSTEVADNVSITGPTGSSVSKTNISWDTSANYKWSDDVSTYARIATGFRAPSIAAPDAFSQLSTADAETITSYEAGIKSDLFNRRARASFSVFSYDIENQQLTAVGGSSNSTRLLNAKKTVGRGAELDFDAKLTDRLRVNLGGSYNFTQIQDPNLVVSGCASCTVTNTLVTPAQGFNNARYAVNGNPLPQAPKWIANISARYEIPMGNNDQLYFATDWSYRSEIDFFLYKSVEFTGKSLLEGGLRAGYKWQGNKYEVNAFARNITNNIVATGAIDFNNLTAFTNEPRIIGMQFRSNF